MSLAEIQRSVSLRDLMSKISASTKLLIQTDLLFKISLPPLRALAAEEHVADRQLRVWSKQRKQLFLKAGHTCCV